jgi:hypothetical protein
MKSVIAPGISGESYTNVSCSPPADREAHTSREGLIASSTTVTAPHATSRQPIVFAGQKIAAAAPRVLHQHYDCQRRNDRERHENAKAAQRHREHQAIRAEHGVPGDEGPAPHRPRERMSAQRVLHRQLQRMARQKREERRRRDQRAAARRR